MITGGILILVGLLMLCLELFLPGGVMGVAGAVVAVAGLILFGVYSPSALLTAGVLAATLVCAGLMVHFTLKYIRRTGKKGTIFLDSDQEGYRASTFDPKIIGKTGVALTDLRPAGHIMIGTERWQAVAEVGYLKKDTPIVVVRGEGAHVIVRRLNTQVEE